VRAMKAYLKFSLPEEQAEFRRTLKASSVYRVLEELDEYMRQKVKYDASLTEQQIEVVENVRHTLYELLKEFDVELFEV
jgi:hypothetical protein